MNARRAAINDPLSFDGCGSRRGSIPARRRIMRSLFKSFPVVLLAPMLVLAGPVDINTADADTLAKELKGIGKARAEAIVAFRNENGPFKSADDLALVKGIPQYVIDDNR